MWWTNKRRLPIYQPIETTAARTIWIDSLDENRLGFQDSSRVQIDRDPVGVTDWKEPGDAFKATLLGGMWPDDDELRLLVVGVVPGGEMAHNYLGKLVPVGTKLKTDDLPFEPEELYKAQGKQLENIGMEILRSLVQIMPAWLGQMQRSIFVSAKAPHANPQTVKAEATTLKEPEHKMTFDMFRIQVDALLIAAGHHPTDEWMQEGSCQSWSRLNVGHKEGLTPKKFFDAYMENISERTESNNQATPTGSNTPE